MLSVTALAALVFLSALLYASVGHGGASAYLAVMALWGVSPAIMRPTALVLNLLVSSIAFLRFSRAGDFRFRLLWPFAMTSIPLAFVGGRIVLPTNVYRPLLGAILLYAAYRLVRGAPTPASAVRESPPLLLALLLGAGIGLLSGLTGVGGGIFLSPLLLLMGWADAGRTAATSSAFILVNSVAGLAGQTAASIPVFHGHTPVLAPIAAVGGWLGAEYGARRINRPAFRRLLALVLTIAGLKLITET